MVTLLWFYLDTFDGAKPRFLNRGKKRRSVSTLSLSTGSRPWVYRRAYPGLQTGESNGLILSIIALIFCNEGFPVSIQYFYLIPAFSATPISKKVKSLHAGILILGFI